MDVSVIIPFYQGNRYLPKLKQILEKLCREYAGDTEVILVNDSPGAEADFSVLHSDSYKLEILTHEKNAGIHQARVTGLLKAKGEFILFLDQDDMVKPEFLKVMCAAFEEDTAFVFANGIFEDSKGKKPVLNSYGKVKAAMDYRNYIYVGNLLASPGQCLIRKNAIPSVWTDNIMKTNCSDDLFLWILLLKNGKSKFVNKVLYRHITTDSNQSANPEVGYKSDYEVCTILAKNKVLPMKLQKYMSLRCGVRLHPEKYGKLTKFRVRMNEKIRRGFMKIAGIFYYLKKRSINL